MQAPGITRYRRPFLAPLWVSLCGLVLLAALAWAVYRSGPTTVIFLIRPVEAAPGTIDDPPLAPEGEARASRLAQMFGVSGGVDAIYETRDRRSAQTAAPLAERLHRAPVVFASDDAATVAARALREHSGGTMLVVGTGAALAQMVRQLTGAAPPAAVPDESDLLYVVSVPRFGRAHLVRLRI
jgi:2,3-bisphosphoglycerate-dependent phosphoglycerate mutase